MAQHNKDKGKSPIRTGPAGRGYPGIRAAAGSLGLAVLSALLLSAAFPPLEISWLAYLAPVPLIVMAMRGRTGRRVFLAGWLGGTVFFGINMYWIMPISVVGGIALDLYLGLYWAVFAWGLRRIALATRLPLAVLAPVLWVALELFRGWFLTGLPWIYIGHTQYENLTLIQTADLFGAYAQSFLVLMTAGLLADVLVRPIFVPTGATPQRRFSRGLALAILLVAAAWAGTVGYGWWRLAQPTTRPGPVVASIQTCMPQDLKRAVRHQKFTLADQEKAEEDMLTGPDGQCTLTLQAAREAAALGRKIDLVVWPETMAPGYLNEGFLACDLAQRITDPEAFDIYNYYQRRYQMYWKTIRTTARDPVVNAPILFGCPAVMFEGVYGLTVDGRTVFLPAGLRYNLACLVGPGTKDYSAEATYAKAHLVPFGEYMPFKHSFPALYNLLQHFSPYPFDYSLTPGAHDQPPMTVKYEKGEARFLVPICYEDAMAYRCREMVRPAEPGGRKNVDFLVNISNDGWFDGSIELDQHLALCVFRAVENRVPIVRSVNTGISAIISPTGRIEATVHDKDGNRRWLTGEISGALTLDDRLAPYTMIGDVFAFACAGVSVGLGLITIFFARRAA